ncbi:chaperone modulatory protein CbpM [Paucimonas lemoignei]|uniref:Chaperone modulatory protein CbpM n=2 Tax=Paucimonas lemoignei TaxID=29443 RepID=A0A4R3HUY6_PAULE|nr:chaperone modulatory protein CbpM [Paucimonas lemoignei]
MVNVADWLWLNDEGFCSAQHLLEYSGLAADELDDLVENGVITPIDKTSRPQSFQLHYISVARLARRLRDDFELDRRGITLAMTLINRINELESERNRLRARLIHNRANYG